MGKINLELRARVERLLACEGRPADLHRIFLALREYNFGRETFKEIGDFVAHADQRTRGLTIRRAIDYATFVRFFFPLWQGFEGDRDQAAVAAGLNAALRLKNEAQMSSDLGLTPAAIKSVVGSLSRNIIGVKNRINQLRRPLTARETAVFNYLFSKMLMRPAFELNDLTDDFIYVLARNGLLQEGEIPAASTLAPFIGLFAIAHMQGTTLSLGPGDDADLFAVVTDDSIVMRAGLLAPQTTGVMDRLSLPFFGLHLPPDLICDPDLLKASEGDEDHRLPMFELDDEWMLRPLA
jgi:hypothetical protein